MVNAAGLLAAVSYSNVTWTGNSHQFDELGQSGHPVRVAVDRNLPLSQSERNRFHSRDRSDIVTLGLESRGITITYEGCDSRSPFTCSGSRSHYLMATAARATTLTSVSRRKRRARELWWYVLLAAAVVLVYGRSIGFDLLLWDDTLIIRDNPLLFPRFTWNNLVEFWSGPQVGLYMPVTFSFLGIEAWISQQLPWNETDGAAHPWIFHTGNVLLHIVCVSLVYTILRDLRFHRRAACLGALLFALHPMQAESVAWATETKTLLGGVWVMATVCVYLRYDADLVKAANADRIQSWRRLFAPWYLLATTFFILALLSKPTTVVTPLLAGLLAWWFHGRKVGRHLVALGPWLILAGVLVVVTKGEQPDAGVHTVPGVIGRLLVAGDAMSFYLLKLFIPIGLAMDHGRNPAFVLASNWSYVVWMIPVAVFLLLLAFGRRGPLLIAFLLFIAALLPVSGLVPFQFQNRSTVADRYIYLAMLGPSLALAAFIERRANFRMTMAVFAILATLGAATFRQTGFWRNDETLFTRGLEINPDSHAALINLSLVRLRQASEIDASYGDQAKELLDRALEIAPTPQVRVEDLCRVATAMLTQGDVEGAIERLLEAHRLNPENAKVYSSLGDVFALAGDHQAALDYYRKASAQDPKFLNPIYRTGDMLCKLRQFEEAEAAYQRALLLRPGLAVALRGLASCYADTGNHQRALATYDEAIQCGPTQWLNYYEKGLLLFRLGQFQEAAGFILKATQLNPRVASVHNDLATTLVKLRRLPEAAAHYRTAIELDPELDDARSNLRKVESAMRQR